MPKSLKIFFAKAPGGLDLMIRHVEQADITPGHSLVKELRGRSANPTATVNELLWPLWRIATTPSMAGLAMLISARGEANSVGIYQTPSQ